MKEREIGAYLISAVVVIIGMLFITFVIPLPLKEWYREHGFNKVTPLDIEETEWYSTSAGMLWNLDREGYVFPNDKLHYLVLFESKSPHPINIEPEFQLFVGEKNVTNNEKLDYVLHMDQNDKTDGISYTLFAHDEGMNRLETSLKIINASNNALLGIQNVTTKFDVSSQSVKLQDESNKTSGYALFISLSTGLGTLVAMGLTVIYTVKQVNHSKENAELQNKRIALLKTIEMLSNPQARDARKKIFNRYWEIHIKDTEEKKNSFIPEGELKRTADSVISSFDQIGVMIEHKILDEDLFLEIYGGMVIRTWKALQEYIVSNNDEFASYFKKLNKKAEQYFTNKKQSIPELYIDPEFDYYSTLDKK